MLAPHSPQLLKDSAAQRATMVDCQIRTFDVTDQRVIARFLEVPRELFVPDDVRDLAYSDVSFRAGTSDHEGRYLLPPFVLARMMQGARLKASDRALDVGAATGYTTALLSGLVAEVVALESDDTLSRDLRDRLAAFGLDFKVCEGSLGAGAQQSGPFDVIFVNGTIRTDPNALFDQLAEGGRLVAIRRSANDPTGRAAQATCYEKVNNTIGSRYLFGASAPCLAAFEPAPQFVF